MQNARLSYGSSRAWGRRRRGASCCIRWTGRSSPSIPTVGAFRSGLGGPMAMPGEPIRRTPKRMRSRRESRHRCGSPSTSTWSRSGATPARAGGRIVPHARSRSCARGSRPLPPDDKSPPISGLWSPPRERRVRTRQLRAGGANRQALQSCGLEGQASVGLEALIQRQRGG